MLNEAGVDLVAVCAPPQLHAEIGFAVVDAGKHLFMEKPLALSLHDADRLMKRAAGAGGKALIGFNWRWHRLICRTRSIINEGALGPLATMHTTFTSASAFPREDFGLETAPRLGRRSVVRSRCPSFRPLAI